MAIPADHKHNFEVLRQACFNKDLAIVECRDAKTMLPAFAICVVQREGDDYQLFPIARMLEDIDELLDPTLESDTPIANQEFRPIILSGATDGEEEDDEEKGDQEGIA